MNNSSDQVRQLRRWLLVMFLVAAVLAMLWRQVPPSASDYDRSVAVDCDESISILLDETTSGCTQSSTLLTSPPGKH